MDFSKSVFILFRRRISLKSIRNYPIVFCVIRSINCNQFVDNMETSFELAIFLMKCLGCLVAAGPIYMLQHPFVFDHYMKLHDKNLLASEFFSKQMLYEKENTCQGIAHTPVFTSVTHISKEYVSKMEAADVLTGEIAEEYSGAFMDMLHKMVIIPTAVPSVYQREMDVVPCIFNGDRILLLLDSASEDYSFVLWSKKVDIPKDLLLVSDDAGGYVSDTEIDDKSHMERITDVLGLIEVSPDIVITTDVNNGLLEQSYVMNTMAQNAPNFCTVDDFTRHRLCAGAYIASDSYLPQDLQTSLYGSRFFVLREQQTCADYYVTLTTPGSVRSVIGYNLLPCAISTAPEEPLFYLQSDHLRIDGAYFLIKNETTNTLNVLMYLQNIKAYADYLNLYV